MTLPNIALCDDGNIQLCDNGNIALCPVPAPCTCPSGLNEYYNITYSDFGSNEETYTVQGVGGCQWSFGQSLLLFPCWEDEYWEDEIIRLALVDARGGNIYSVLPQACLWLIVLGMGDTGYESVVWKETGDTPIGTYTGKCIGNDPASGNWSAVVTEAAP